MLTSLLNVAETFLLLSVTAIYVVHCPYSKVEESFNTQAIHDIINLFPGKLPYQDVVSGNRSVQEIATRSHLPWDHILFPGVVPRTFVGALLVGLPMKIAIHLMALWTDYHPDRSAQEDEPDFTSQFVMQLGSRFALSSLVVLSLTAITKAVQRRYGLPFRLCFLSATVSQFHYMFYAGRFIPNTFAAILANLAFASWINRRHSQSIIYIALCVVIFRFDSSLFFGLLLIDAIFIRRNISIAKVLKVGIPAGVIALLITLIVDSIFWARPVWPELEALHFNIWLNKSHEWGTQPYLWYIYSCLPRMMLACGPLILLADHKITRDYLLPTLAFIFTYSLLPHKELRFILFTTPFLNICVASGLMNIHFYTRIFLGRITANRKRVDRAARVTLALILLVIIAANVSICTILSRISSHNYPGGQAALSLGTTKELLASANNPKRSPGLVDYTSGVGVYVNNLAAQSGMTRFLQVDGVYYAKPTKLDERTFRKVYKLLYLILEPSEVSEFLRHHCLLDKHQEHLIKGRAENWRRINDEIRCELPNQPQMLCSIVDSISAFKSVNIGGLWSRLKQMASLQHPINPIDDDVFIRTRIALNTVRCSTKSKFNPFA